MSTNAATINLSSYMKCLKPHFTKIRDKNTSHMEFVKYADRLMSIICEEGFAYSTALSLTDIDQNVVDTEKYPDEHVVTTPTGAAFSGDYLCVCFILCCRLPHIKLIF